jgi:hypothetical protein
VGAANVSAAAVAAAGAAVFGGSSGTGTAAAVVLAVVAGGEGEEDLECLDSAELWEDGFDAGRFDASNARILVADSFPPRVALDTEGARVSAPT